MKWILKYLRGTLDVVICYISLSLQNKGFVDSNFGKDKDGWKSTKRCTFTFVDGVVRWKSNLYPLMDFSTNKVEYVAKKKENKVAICRETIG